MKLNSITIKNVKSFKEEVTFVPDKQFNVLIGSNGGGKSNLMEIVYVSLRHFLVYPYRWSNDRYEEGYRKNLIRDNSPFGPVGQLLTRYSGNNSDSVITIELEVTESDVWNLALIRDNSEALRDEAQNYNSIDRLVVPFLSSEHKSIEAGASFTYRIINNSLQRPANPDELYFLNYLQTIEAISFLAQDVEIELYPTILYISPFRGVSDFGLSQSLADANSNGERTEVMRATSRSTSSLIKLATLFFAEKRRLLEATPGGWEKKWNKDKQVRFVNDSLSKLGYSWDLELRDPNRNTYIIKLKKDGKDFLLSQASSGEVELINFIFGMVTLGLKSGIIIVDEPELHLHPKWIAFLRGFFREYAFTEKNQIMIITHSATFINSSTYPYITRIYRLPEGYSSLYKVKEDDKKETREKLHFINATNNEKVFFSDFVIMVEGDTDEIVFKCLLDHVKRDRDIKANVDVMQIGGKTNYESFSMFLKTLRISSCFIGDIDNISQFATGNERIKSMLITNDRRVVKMVFKNPGSKDNVKLTDFLLEAINSGNTDNLREFYQYIISFRQKLRSDLSEDDKQVLKSFIMSLYDENVFILSEGEIEDYFPDGFKHKDLDNALQLTQGDSLDKWKTEKGYSKLYGLLCEALDRNSVS